MFKVVTTIKGVFFTTLFVAAFFLFSEILYQQAVILLLYLIYMRMPGGNADFRAELANVLTLSYLKRIDNGSDKQLTDATDKLLESLQSESSLMHVTEVNPQEVIDIDSAKLISSTIDGFVFFGLLVAMIARLILQAS